MDGFGWAQRNIEQRVGGDLPSPQALQDRGVQVYFAPMIASDQKLVNLADGRIEQFFEGEERPESGYFAEFDSLERFCRREGLPLSEVDAQAVMLPTGDEGDAGDPISKSGQ